MFFSPLGFSLLSVLPLSLLCFFVFLLLPGLSSLPSFPPFFSPCSQRSWPLFIEAKDAVFYSSHGGAAGWSAIGRSCRGSVGGAREWPAEIQIKASLSPSSPLRDRGKKMNSVVQNDTVLLFLSFFLFLNV